MGLRFRKRISLGKGFGINIGKKSIGFTGGVRGARVGMGSRGPYTSFGIPGTGLYYFQYAGKGSRRASGATAEEEVSGVIGCLWLIAGAFALWLVIAHPLVALALFVVFLAVLIFRHTHPSVRATRKTLKAKEMLEERRLTPAEILAKEALELDPGNTEARGLLGLILSRREKHKEAVPHLRKYLEKNGHDTSAKYLLAESLYHSGNYGEAIALFQQIPEDSEFFLKALEKIGACFYEQGEYELALDVLKRAPLQKRKFSEDLKAVHYLLGKAYEALGQRKRALRHFKRLYAQDINYRDVGEVISRLESE